MIYVSNIFEKLLSANFVNGNPTTFHLNLHIRHLPLHPLSQRPHHLRWFQLHIHSISSNAWQPSSGSMPPERRHFRFLSIIRSYHRSTGFGLHLTS